jgi:hypothetical protein
MVSPVAAKTFLCRLAISYSRPAMSKDSVKACGYQGIASPACTNISLTEATLPTCTHGWSLTAGSTHDTMRLRPHPSTPTPAATSTAKDEDSTLDHELTFRPHTAQIHTFRPPAYHQLFPQRVIPRRENTEEPHSDVRISPILDTVRKSQQTKQKEAAKRAEQEANKMSITTIDEGHGIAVGYPGVGVGRMEALGAPAPALAVTSHYPHIPIT